MVSKEEYVLMNGAPAKEQAAWSRQRGTAVDCGEERFILKNGNAYGLKSLIDRKRIKQLY